MPNHGTHVLIGAIGGALLYVVHKRWMGEPISLAGLLFAAGLGAMAATIPDLLEPPIHPNHRGTAHSALALLGVAYTAMETVSSDALTDADKELILALAAGYASHLAADATTPMGLPVA